MKYNRPQATASWGQMAKDWEQGVDYSRLSKERLARAQNAVRHAGLGAVLAFNFDNIRYITATHILERIHPKTLVVNDPKEVRKQRAERAKKEGRANPVTGGRPLAERREADPD